MTDLIGLLGTLVDVKGNILVPGVNKSVLPVTKEEKDSYDPIDFDLVRKINKKAIKASLWHGSDVVLGAQWNDKVSEGDIKFRK